MIQKLFRTLVAKHGPPNPLLSANYNNDCLAVWQKTTGFLREEKFLKAYRKGVESGHKFSKTPAELHIEWRVHTVLAFAQYAALLDGDFVECGVNTGIYSLAICEYLEFNKLGKNIYLFDTYSGIPIEQMTEDEIEGGRPAENEFYTDCYRQVCHSFREYKNAHIIQGLVPASLRTVNCEKVCYLSIDMNIVKPEIDALNFFWEKLAPGAPIVLDDYGWEKYKPQKEAHDEFARSKGLTIVELPTGQGILLKPPRRSE